MWVKRVALAALGVGAAGALLWTGATLALFFASTPTQTTSLASGSVTLGAPASTMINVSGIVPGFSDPKTYAVTYTGSAAAWLGVSANVSGDLSTCDGGQLQVTVADVGSPGITYRVNQPNPEVLRTGGTPSAPIASPVSAGTTKTFAVTYALPLDTSNDCQSKTASIQLQVVAVQSQFNTNGSNNGPLNWGALPPLVLDQSNSGPAIVTGTPAGDFGELFTAGRTGALEKVRIGFYGTPTSDVTVTIRSVSGGLPSGAVLATTTIPAANVPASASDPLTLVDAVFATPATVTAGTQYAFVVNMQGGIQVRVTGDNYPGGYWVYDSGGWQLYTGYDLYFETYVR